MSEFGIKTRKKRKPKYATEIDRIGAVRVTKNKSNHKNKPVKATIKLLYGTFNDRYRSGLFRYLITKDFHAMATFTCSENVTLKELETLIKKVLQTVTGKGIIACYFKVNELHNYRYHAHVLIEDAGVVKSLTGLLKRYWKDYGNVDVQRIKDEQHKRKVVNYCLKQLKPEDRRHVIQELVDTWDYYETPVPVITYDLFKNQDFLNSIWQQKDYMYQRPAGSLIIPGMTSEDAFKRIQAKMDNRQQPQIQLAAIYR